MTYCIGMLVREGLVMMADTRTNAGVDNISTYRKLRLYGNDGKRLIAVASAGSLSTTQGAIQRVTKGLAHPETGKYENWGTFQSIYDAAIAAGRALRQVRDSMQDLAQAGVNFDATLLVGGSINGEPSRLFLVYSAGNTIECAADTPYLQIGELKYGKPILDRALHYDTPLNAAVKLGLLSFDSTMRANLAVGLPIDLMVAEAGAGQARTNIRIEESDDYYLELSQLWQQKLAKATDELPLPSY
ncbi:peptidase [Sphingomonas sp. MAH-20]|uniref:Peptidase n=2 Tax=Sphingomonas horti TaxID=2682842 RepID=A0A6I4IX51_9SPHN|nr:peptidase [Sphingomonas sp. CGMCC 1.13658]MBA2920446.1 peptidase [Sphingomonas sp. CGMCC 1.13658]MVO76699.1 peptidase [Sphingomonas horti]